MTVNIVYTGGLRTQATHLQSGSVIETDAPTDNHGKGERFSPTDLVATALGSCILTTMGLAANVHKINIDGTTCQVEKIMASGPRRIAEIKVIVDFPAAAQYNDKEKKILETAAITCPVAESLSSNCVKDLTFNWPAE